MILRERLLIWGQYCIPKHLISRIVGLATNSRILWVKDTIIQWFVKTYRVDLSEALESNLATFPSFNAFFTRALKPSARPLPDDPRTFVSPADGVISQAGIIEHHQIIQAKNHFYSITNLLAGETALAETFRGGTAITIYLSPRDYHRVHIPLDGVLTAMWFVPGDLFSVNTLTTQRVPGLFARNERVIALFQTPMGQMAVILVGALICASIRTVWDGIIAPNTHRKVQKTLYPEGQHVFSRGAEIGSFALGSTVIVLTEQHAIQLDPHYQTGTTVKVRERLGIGAYHPISVT